MKGHSDKKNQSSPFFLSFFQSLNYSPLPQIMNEDLKGVVELVTGQYVNKKARPYDD